MAEFLIRVRDKTSPDIYKDVQLLKRGDVVSICDDGHAWGIDELSNPAWRIIRVLAISQTEANAFLSPEPGDPLTNRTLQRLGFNLNLDDVTLPTAAKSFIADDSRKTVIAVLTLAQLRAIKQTKPPVKDPAIIG